MLMLLHKGFELIVTCRLQKASLGAICRSKSSLMKWFLYRPATGLIFLVQILYQVKIRYNDHWSGSHVNSSNRPIGLFYMTHSSVMHLHRYFRNLLPIFHFIQFHFHIWIKIFVTNIFLAESNNQFWKCELEFLQTL